MKLQKKYLEVFYKVIKGYKTDKMSQARLRDSFLRTAGEPLDQFIKDRNVIYVNFCKKNEDGTPDIKEDKYAFEPQVIEEVTKELQTLLDEEIEIEVPAEVKDMIEESSYVTEPGETLVVDEILKTL